MMKTHRFSAVSLAALVPLLIWLTGIAGASPLARPLLQGGAPTVVNYQGQVRVAGQPYSGTGHLKFAIVDQAGATTFWSNDGTSSDGGEPTAAVPLPVSSGLFTVLLGDTSLDGMTRALGPAVFGAPERYLRVWFSTSAAGPFQRLEPDRRIAAVPYALQADEARNADLLDGKHADELRTRYQNVVVVAKSGGDHTSIQAALNSITDATATNRYLVWVGPGEYHGQVTMKPYVDIEGAGELVTTITHTSAPAGSGGTVRGASDAELRNLTVRSTGGGATAMAILNDKASPRLTHVIATASGAEYNYAVYNAGSSPAMTEVTATASGGGHSYAVYNNNSSPTMTNVTATASEGDHNSGVYNNSSSSPVMTNVTATASGGSKNYGVFNSNSSPTIRQSSICATGTSGTRIGIGSTSTAGLHTVHVDHSRVEGVDYAIVGHDQYRIYVGVSQLIGAINASSGTVKCVGVYNSNYAPMTCP